MLKLKNVSMIDDNGYFIDTTVVNENPLAAGEYILPRGCIDLLPPDEKLPVRYRYKLNADRTKFIAVEDLSYLFICQGVLYDVSQLSLETLKLVKDSDITLIISNADGATQYLYGVQIDALILATSRKLIAMKGDDLAQYINKINRDERSGETIEHKKDSIICPTEPEIAAIRAKRVIKDSIAQ